MEKIGSLFPEIGGFSPRHPWWGFSPQPLMPGDDRIVTEILLRAIKEAHALTVSSSEYLSLAEEDSLVMSAFATVAKSLGRVPEPPVNLLSGLLPKFFGPHDMGGYGAERTLKRVFEEIHRARNLLEEAASVLVSGHGLMAEEIRPLFDAASRKCHASVLQNDPITQQIISDALQAAVARFDGLFGLACTQYEQVTEDFLRGLSEKLSAVAGLNIDEMPWGELEEATVAVTEKLGHLNTALKKVRAVTENRNLSFDGSPDAINRLMISGPADLKRGLSITDEEILKARDLCRFPLSGYSLVKLKAVEEELHGLWDTLRKSFEPLEIDRRGAWDRIRRYGAVGARHGRPCRNCKPRSTRTAPLQKTFFRGVSDVRLYHEGGGSDQA